MKDFSERELRHAIFCNHPDMNVKNREARFESLSERPADAIKFIERVNFSIQVMMTKP